MDKSHEIIGASFDNGFRLTTPDKGNIRRIPCCQWHDDCYWSVIKEGEKFFLRELGRCHGQSREISRAELSPDTLAVWGYDDDDGQDWRSLRFIAQIKGL